MYGIKLLIFYGWIVCCVLSIQVWSSPSADFLSDALRDAYEQLPNTCFSQPRAEFICSDRLPASGIKLHISAKEENAREIASTVLPLLLDHKMVHKIVKDTEKLKELWESKTQKGKFITIYSKTGEEALSWAAALDEFLFRRGFRDKNFVPITGDRPLQKIFPWKSCSGGVFYRLGALTEEGNVFEVLNAQGKVINVVDDRRWYKPLEMANQTTMSLLGFYLHDPAEDEGFTLLECSVEERDEGDFIRLDFVGEEREEKIEFNDLLENYRSRLEHKEKPLKDVWG
jgi:hypothetical protein